MDDNFTTGPKDEDQLILATLARIDKKLDQILAEARDMTQERLDLSDQMSRATTSMLEMKLSQRRDSASAWETYALVQQRLDRLSERVRKIEEKLEPPLPPFPEFKPKP